MDDYYFLAPSVYQIKLGGVSVSELEGPDFLLSPDGAVAIGLWTALKVAGVTATDNSVEPKTGQARCNYWGG